MNASHTAPRWRRLMRRPEAIALLILLLTAFVASRLSPFFADGRFLLESATYSMETACVALMLTLVIIAGEIDLSPAAQMALSACVFGVAFQAGAPVAAAMLASICAALAMGALNAWLVVFLRLPSIIVTIGTLILFRGLAQVLVGDHGIGGFPDWFVGIDQRTVLGVPWSVCLFALVALAVGLVLSMSIVGRQIYQIGTNEVAAVHAGIRVRRIKTGLFLATSVFSACAGWMAVSRLGSVRYDLASGAELDMVLVVMLGGTHIAGGRGSILGTFIAAWLLVIVASGMTVANIAIDAQLTVLGALLIVSVIASNAMHTRDRRP